MPTTNTRSTATLEQIAQLRQADFLTEAEAALVLNVQPSTLRTWRCIGRGPRFVRAGRVIRYRLAAIDRWATQNTKG